MNINNVQLGDVVTTFPPGSGMLSGHVVGVDTQGPAIMVRWERGAMDVYSVDSPVWASMTIERDTPSITDHASPLVARALNAHDYDPDDTAQLRFPWNTGA